MSHERIAMILDNPFRPDPRVQREAEILVEAGYSLDIIAWDRDPDSERPQVEEREGYRILRIRVPTRPQLGVRQLLYFSRFAGQAYRLIAAGAYDIVHCHDFLDLAPGVLLKQRKGLRLVYDAHEIYWLMEAGKYPLPVQSLLRRLEDWLVRFVDAFITVGPRRAHYYRNRVKGPIHVVGNWQEQAESDEALAERLREEHGIPRDAFLLTYAGTLSPIRGTAELIAAAERLDDPEVHWLICGHGPASETVASAARANPRLHYAGWIEDLGPVYSASDALVYLMQPDYPYTPYNSPNNLYASIAWRIPLIGTRAGEIQELLEEPPAGVLLDDIAPEQVVDAARRLRSDRSLRASIVARLGELRQRFNRGRAAENLLAAYAQVTGSEQTAKTR